MRPRHTIQLRIGLDGSRAPVPTWFVSCIAYSHDYLAGFPSSMVMIWSTRGAADELFQSTRPLDFDFVDLAWLNPGRNVPADQNLSCSYRR